MADWFAAASVAAPARTPRAKPRQKPNGKPARARPHTKARRRTHARGPILWILVSALVLAGVVFVNLAVLRLNLRIDGATQERSRLRSDNAALQSQLSSALASPRIQSIARQQYGLVQADPAGIVYVDLGR